MYIYICMCLYYFNLYGHYIDFAMMFLKYFFIKMIGNILYGAP